MIWAGDGTRGAMLQCSPALGGTQIPSPGSQNLPRAGPAVSCNTNSGGSVTGGARTWCGAGVTPAELFPLTALGWGDEGLVLAGDSAVAGPSLRLEITFSRYLHGRALQLHRR